MQMQAAAGYSGTPLVKKLGIGAGQHVLLVGAPEDLPSLLHPLPAGVVFESEAGSHIDLAHIFVTRVEELARLLGDLRKVLRPEVALWVSWPKKASKVPTTVTEDTIRGICTPLGFVDIKVCAVSAVWSGLKLVVRKELR